MKISIFELTHQGCVKSACLAGMGHHVIVRDESPERVRLINDGKSVILEKGVPELVKAARKKELLEATSDCHYAVHHSEISFIMARTPRSRDKNLNLNMVNDIARKIGEALRDKKDFHIVAICSTVPPGTCRKVSEILANVSEKRPGTDFTVVSNPQFMRRGSSVSDFMNPPMTLIGTDSEIAEAKLRELYQDLPGEFIATEIEVAEMMKLVSNSFHALKVAFGNEVGNVCKAWNIDSQKVMDLFCRDTQLNISPAYLAPGFAYGGSCLPKDVRELRTLAHSRYVSTPLLDAISTSNEQQKKAAIELIESKGRRKVGILGLSFKPETEDVRNSPIVDVAQALYGKGYEIHIYDPDVQMSRLTGTNGDFINARLPYLGKILTADLDAVCASCDVLVIAKKAEEFNTLPERYPNKCIVDLVRQFREIDYEGNYEGISWPNLNHNPAQDKDWPRDMFRVMF